MKTQDFTDMRKKLITRPRLAAALMAAGLAVEPALNPYEPRLRAWQVEDNVMSQQVIREFYEALKAQEGR